MRSSRKMLLVLNLSQADPSFIFAYAATVPPNFPRLSVNTQLV
jgi:hypothetical protein